MRVHVRLPLQCSLTNRFLGYGRGVPGNINWGLVLHKVCVRGTPHDRARPPQELPRQVETKKAHRKKFTDANLDALAPRTKMVEGKPKGVQYYVWDAGTGAARGLGVLVSPAGAKSYRSTYYSLADPSPTIAHLAASVSCRLRRRANCVVRIVRTRRPVLIPR